ncbi:MAG: hypothetical protein PUH16_03470 [Clostridiales bacterium]|nr:hypothetical protein [Clostridiales bacterium]MDY2721872.1 hypothetical protein [Eubacteriales bacterium]
MKGNDDKFGLYVVIAFLASIIIFAATFLIPIRSAFLQYVSGGVMITSFVCLLLSICKKLKESKEEKKYDNELSKTHSITRNPIDSKFYSNIIGKYKNSGSICFRKKSIKFFSLDNIYKIIKKYSNISSIENFIIFAKTNKLLNSAQEKEIRNIIQQLNGKVAIVKDISSFDLPDNVYDVNILYIKTNYENLSPLFQYLKNFDFDIINIFDDYNPNIFSYNDINIAANENFNFKFFIDRKMNICQVYMRYGLIENTENFLDGLFNHLS